MTQESRLFGIELVVDDDPSTVGARLAAYARIIKAWNEAKADHGDHRPFIHTIGCYRKKPPSDEWWCTAGCEALRVAFAGAIVDS